MANKKETAFIPNVSISDISHNKQGQYFLKVLAPNPDNFDENILGLVRIEKNNIRLNPHTNTATIEMDREGYRVRYPENDASKTMYHSLSPQTIEKWSDKYQEQTYGKINIRPNIMDVEPYNEKGVHLKIPAPTQANVHNNLITFIPNNQVTLSDQSTKIALSLDKKSHYTFSYKQPFQSWETVETGINPAIIRKAYDLKENPMTVKQILSENNYINQTRNIRSQKINMPTATNNTQSQLNISP